MAIFNSLKNSVLGKNESDDKTESAEKPNDSIALDGESLNQVIENTAAVMHAVKEGRQQVTSLSLPGEISTTRKDQEYQRDVASGKILPYPTCTLSQAAKFCGVSEGQILQFLEKHQEGFSHILRQGHPNEFWSACMHGAKFFIRKSCGFETPKFKKSSDSGKNICIVPTRDEMISRFSIRVRPE